MKKAILLILAIGLSCAVMAQTTSKKAKKEKATAAVVKPAAVPAARQPQIDQAQAKFYSLYIGVDSASYPRFIAQLDTLRMIVDNANITHSMAKNYMSLLTNIQTLFRQEREQQDKYPLVELRPDSSKKQTPKTK